MKHINAFSLDKVGEALLPPLKRIRSDEEPMSFGWSDFPLVGHSDNQCEMQRNYSEDVASITTDEDSSEGSDEESQETDVVMRTDLSRHPNDIPIIHSSTISSFSWVDFPSFQSDDTITLSSGHTLSQQTPDDFQQYFPNVVELSDSEVDDASLRSSLLSTVTLTPSQQQRKPRREVHFDTVHIREYSLILGDHPLADGFPLSLGWEHGELSSMSVDEYESRREPHSEIFKEPRRLTELERRSRLEEVTGLSAKELNLLERKRTQIDVSQFLQKREAKLVTRLERCSAMTDLRRSLRQISLDDE